jgi:hypothetical protein
VNDEPKSGGLLRASDLIAEGLRQRQQQGSAAAALPFF